jgi:quinolinate synthase
MDAARKPLERMLEMAGGTVGKGDVGKPVLSDAEGPIVEDSAGGVPPEEIDPTISGD